MKKRIKKRMNTAQFKKKIMKLTGQKRPPSVKKKRKYTKRSPIWKQKKARKINKTLAKQATKLKVNKISPYTVPKYAYALSFPLRGMQFYNGFDGKAGDKLILKAIDDNAFDPFAIAVCDVNGSQIGWFPRDIHPVTKERSASKFQIVLHRLLKQDKGYRLTVQEIRPFSPVIAKLELAK